MLFRKRITKINSREMKAQGIKSLSNSLEKMKFLKCLVVTMFVGTIVFLVLALNFDKIYVFPAVVWAFGFGYFLGEIKG